MKVKRFFAADMRQAIRMVRADIGPDAVILSTKRVRGGVELIAAMEYDEAMLVGAVAPAEAGERTAPPPSEPAATAPQKRIESEVSPAASAAEAPARERRVSPAPLAQVEWSQDPALTEMQREMQRLRGMMQHQLSGLAWGDLSRNQPVRADIIRRLAALDLAMPLARELAQDTDGKELESSWRRALAGLAARIPLGDGGDILDHGGVVALVGPTGVGKTTTIAKLAARFALRNGTRQVAMVTTDGYRIGAHDQLRTFGQILGVPVHQARDAAELRRVLKGLADRKLVLVDTAGMSHRDLRLGEQFATLNGGASLIRTYLVLSANTQRSVLNETIKAFRRIELEGCILSKLDESASLGGAFSALIRHGLPLSFVTDGQRVPEDLQPARAHNLVNRAVELLRQQEERPDDEELAMAFSGRVVHA